MGGRRRLTLVLIFVCSSVGFLLCTFLHLSDPKELSAPRPNPHHAETQQNDATKPAKLIPSTKPAKNIPSTPRSSQRKRSQPVQTNKLDDSYWIVDCITWNHKRRRPDPGDTQLYKLPPTVAGEEHEKRKQVFIDIFQKKDWPIPQNDLSDELQVSGPGAVLRNAQGAIAALHTIVNEIKLKLGKDKITLLDIPCGDFQWMSKFLKTRDDIEYTGYDIVPQLISHHRKHFSNFKRVKFEQHDIITNTLNSSFDLVFCRDMLQHLWLTDAMRALHKISQSGSKFVLVTTFPGTKVNNDVDRRSLGGRKSPYNLELAPFSLVSPLCNSYDWNVENLALWHLPLRQRI